MARLAGKVVLIPGAGSGQGWAAAIHAGIAQTKEFDLDLWFRRAAAGTTKLGTAVEHRQRIARHLLEGQS